MSDHGTYIKRILSQQYIENHYVMNPKTTDYYIQPIQSRHPSTGLHGTHHTLDKNKSDNYNYYEEYVMWFI